MTFIKTVLWKPTFVQAVSTTYLPAFPALILEEIPSPDTISNKELHIKCFISDRTSVDIWGHFKKVESRNRETIKNMPITTENEIEKYIMVQELRKI